MNARIAGFGVNCDECGEKNFPLQNYKFQLFAYFYRVRFSNKHYRDSGRQSLLKCYSSVYSEQFLVYALEPGFDSNSER